MNPKGKEDKLIANYPVPVMTYRVIIYYVMKQDRGRHAYKSYQWGDRQTGFLPSPPVEAHAPPPSLLIFSSFGADLT